MTKKFALAAAAALTLAACGGSSSGNGVPGFASFDDGVDRYGALLDAILENEPTSPSDIPTSGDASYLGVIGLNPINDQSDVVIGGVNVKVDFDAGELSGNAGNFRAADNTPRQGSLRLEDGQLRRSGDVVVATMDIRGSVELQGELRGVNADGSAIFVGDDATYLGGSIFGTMRGDSNIRPRIEGAFLAAQ